jgi:hypothetical protein
MENILHYLKTDSEINFAYACLCKTFVSVQESDIYFEIYVYRNTLLKLHKILHGFYSSVQIPEFRISYKSFLVCELLTSWFPLNAAGDYNRFKGRTFC